MQTKVCEVTVANAVALAVANYLPAIVIYKCPQAPLSEITILCPDRAELQPGWLAALLKQQRQGVVALLLEASASSNTSLPSSEHYRCESSK